MTSLRDELTSGSGGVFTTASGPIRVMAVADHLGWTTHLLDTGGVADKDTLMSRLVSALGLPGYFGRNWDALQDCLSDLESSPGTLVMWVGANDLPQELREPLVQALGARSHEADAPPFALVRHAR